MFMLRCDTAMYNYTDLAELDMERLSSEGEAEASLRGQLKLKLDFPVAPEGWTVSACQQMEGIFPSLVLRDL